MDPWSRSVAKVGLLDGVAWIWMGLIRGLIEMED